jgi:hypothetical protein
MIEFPAYEIDEFGSFSEYQKLLGLVEELIVASKVIEIQPVNGYDMFPRGRWFRRIETREIWRLLEPDYGFHGLWNKIEVDKLPQQNL